MEDPRQKLQLNAKVWYKHFLGEDVYDSEEFDHSVAIEELMDDYAKAHVNASQPPSDIVEAKDMKATEDSAIFIEELGISGDHMVDVPDGAMYLYDILDAYSEPNTEMLKVLKWLSHGIGWDWTFLK